MKKSFWILIAAAAAAGVHAADTPVDTGIAEIEALGRINGQALACSEQSLSARAKELVIKHAPRTPRYGAAFEQATQRGFMEQIKGKSTCPATGDLAQRLDLVAAELGRKLPATE